MFQLLVHFETLLKSFNKVVEVLLVSSLGFCLLLWKNFRIITLEQILSNSIYFLYP